MSDIGRGQAEQEEERLRDFQKRWDRRFMRLWQINKTLFLALSGSAIMAAFLGIALNAIWLARFHRHAEDKLAAGLAEQKGKEIVASSGYPRTYCGAGDVYLMSTSNGATKSYFGTDSVNALDEKMQHWIEAAPGDSVCDGVFGDQMRPRAPNEAVATDVYIRGHHCHNPLVPKSSTAPVRVEDRNLYDDNELP